jgi:hypothetical protein
MSNSNMLPTGVEYSPTTGVLSRNGRPCSQTPSAQGYLRVMVKRKALYQHRVIFFLMEGRWPEQVDHINGDRSDNRWSNLREATHSQNNLNKKSLNITKRLHGWWDVRVQRDKKVYQERYKCFGQAVKAAKTMKQQVCGEYNYE